MSPSEEEIFELIRQESGDSLQRMETSLLALESGNGGPDDIDGILRSAHSIKGSAAMVGWHEIATLASAIEDHMEQARESGTVSPALADTLLRAIDVLARALHGESGIAAPLVEELAALGELDAAGAPTPAPGEAPVEPQPVEQARIEQEPDDRQAD